MELQKLTDFLDEYLAINEYEDTSLNGLQVEGAREINKIAIAVDACSETFMKAAALRADLLLTHHGIYWKKPYALTGIHANRVRLLFNNNLSLYAAHLPLDLHPIIGNNVSLIEMMGLELGEKFGTYHGITIGYTGTSKKSLSLDNLVKRLEDGLKVKSRVYNFGSEDIKTVAAISGGGASMLEQVWGSDIDTFITGEYDHVSYHSAKEMGINLIFCGHYATETLGVNKLGKIIEDKFGIESVFVDVPTGM